MTIEADPSLRAAMQTAGAQVLGGALGPLLASFTVGEREIHGALWLGTAMLLAGMAIVTWLHVTAHKSASSSGAGAGDILLESFGSAPVTVSANQPSHDADQ
jgi:hypothetical protein